MRRSGQALCIVFLGLCTTSTAERPHFDLPDVLQVKNDLQPGPSGIVTGGVVIADGMPTHNLVLIFKVKVCVSPAGRSGRFCGIHVFYL